MQLQDRVVYNLPIAYHRITLSIKYSLSYVGNNGKKHTDYRATLWGSHKRCGSLLSQHKASHITVTRITKEQQLDGTIITYREHMTSAQGKMYYGICGKPENNEKRFCS